MKTLSTIFNFSIIFVSLFFFSTAFACNTSGSLLKLKDLRNVGNFNSIDVGGAIDVKVYIGPETSVEVNAPDDMLQHVVTEVRNNTLIVYFKGKGTFNGKAQVIVRTPQLVSAEVTGASSMHISNLNNSSFTLEVSGASTVEVEGSTSSLVIDASGASHMDLSKFSAINATVDVSGASNGILNVSDSLTIDASGASNVEYYGSPKVTSSISGASKIKSRN